jgi:Mg2+ and Co2+ transporter CorA
MSYTTYWQSQYTADRKLQSFLRKQLTALYRKAQRAKNPPTVETVIADLKSRKKLFDYELTEEEKSDRNEVILTFSKPGSQIHVSAGRFNTKEQKWDRSPWVSIDNSHVHTYNPISREIDKCPNLVYLLFENAAQIEKGILELKADIEKQEKIDEMSEQSIKTWVSTILKGSGYKYYISEYNHKIILSIKMEHGTQLDIQIYFRNFQKQMSDLLETIKEYEKVIAASKVKILISNHKINANWKSFK